MSDDRDPVFPGLMKQAVKVDIEIRIAIERRGRLPAVDRDLRIVVDALELQLQVLTDEFGRQDKSLLVAVVEPFKPADVSPAQTGGGALLTNLDKLLSNETGMPVLVSEDALSCVGEGTGKSLENIELLKRVVMTSKKLNS